MKPDLLSPQQQSHALPDAQLLDHDLLRLLHLFQAAVVPSGDDSSPICHAHRGLHRDYLQRDEVPTKRRRERHSGVST